MFYTVVFSAKNWQSPRAQWLRHKWGIQEGKLNPQLRRQKRKCVPQRIYIFKAVCITSYNRWSIQHKSRCFVTKKTFTHAVVVCCPKQCWQIDINLQKLLSLNQWCFCPWNINCHHCLSIVGWNWIKTMNISQHCCRNLSFWSSKWQMHFTNTSC